MYRLVLYYLIFLLAAAIGLSLSGQLHYSPVTIGFSSIYLVTVCYVSNKIFAYVYDVPTNVESVYITALILALIITPVTTAFGVLFLTAAGGLAMASKYMLAINRKHIFNPAAIAVVLTAFGAQQTASWWIGTTALLPFVLIGGVLLIRKINRTEMVLGFLASATAVTALLSFINSQNTVTTLHRLVFSSALFFLAFVMLTEPLTSPTTKHKQIWYGLLVGAFLSPQIHIGSLYLTPEIALIIGNVYAYIVSPKVKILPLLTKKVRVSPDSVDFIFDPERKFAYKPGQYMEWTIPHTNTDSRGNRRYFTLASSPTETNIRIGVKFYSNGSSFKKAMLTIDNRSQVVASNLGGDFVLPKDSSKKIAFIAGGIGITPYRGMIKYLSDTKTPQPVTLLYSATSAEDFVYTDVFEEAKQTLGIKTVYTITGANVPAEWRGRTGMVSAEMIQSEIPDYNERLFYISGSQTMVTSVKETLQSLGVTNNHIKGDFFPGYS